MRQITVKISGMHCASCAGNIEKALAGEPAVVSASVNFAASKAYIEYDPSMTTMAQLRQRVRQAGYELVEQDEQTKDSEIDEYNRTWRKMMFAVALAGPIMALMMVHMLIVTIPHYFIITAALAFPVIFIAGYNTHKGTLRSIINLRPNMDTLVTLGSLIPYLMSFLSFWYPITTFVEMAAAILTLHLVGRTLEARAKGKASQAIKKLLEMGAKNARVLRDGSELQIPVEQLQIDDIMIVKPGEKIPTDGLIVEGTSSVDESMATGESLPVSKKPGQQVIGSAINKQGYLKIKVTKIGQDTFLAQVIKLIEQCQGSKVPIQEFADKVTGYFVPVVIAVAAMAFVSWMVFPDFHRAIAGFFNFPWVNLGAPNFTLAILATTAVLVISCPCALGLATPTALMVGSGMGAQRGILIRQGQAIQTIKDVAVVVFDKTGTITKGQPDVTDIHAFEPANNSQVLTWAAALENASEHPLAQAVVAHAKQQNINIEKPRDFQAVAGMGIVGSVGDKKILVGTDELLSKNGIDPGPAAQKRAQLEDQAKTVMLVAADGKLAGLIAVADTVKENAKQVIAEIESFGIATAIITGDNERTARAIAADLAIDDVIANVLPEGKVSRIRDLQQKYGTVAMVGDGINDAPALKQANVGIALGTGTDVAIESADITLIKGDLAGVISAIKLSNATFAKIKQNYFWAWFYNAVAIPAAFLGLLHPVIGAAAMAASSLNVVLNSLRLKRADIEPAANKYTD